MRGGMWHVGGERREGEGWGGGRESDLTVTDVVEEACRGGGGGKGGDTMVETCRKMGIRRAAADT